MLYMNSISGSACVETANPALMDIFALKGRASHIDAQLKPIGEREPDFNDPNWLDSIANGPHPLDEAGVRVDAEKLTSELLELYAAGDGDVRENLRQLFRDYKSFAWATVAPLPPTTVAGFRQHMLLLSVIDHAQDPRDLATAVNDLCAKARASDVEVKPILQEVASLSSDSILPLVGSVRKVFENAC